MFHFLAQTRRSIFIRFFIILFTFFGYLFYSSNVLAQELNVSEPVSPEKNVVLESPLQLPDQEVTIKGSGEPGAKIRLTVYSGSTVLVVRETTVGLTGLWQVSLPQFSETKPTRLSIASEIPYTAIKVIETTSVASAAAVSSFVLIQLFLERGLRALQFIGLLRKRKTKGYVFDTVTKKPVAFALLTIQNYFEADNAIKPFKETVVTSVDGFFQTVFLPPGKYTISVAHSDYQFPSRQTKPNYASPFEFYQGEVIELIGQEQLEVFFIPLDPKNTPQVLKGHWFNFSVIFTMIASFGQMITIPMGVLSLVVLIAYPSFINFAIFSFYVVFVCYEVYKRWNTRTLQGKVLQKNKKPVVNAVVRVFNPKSNELLKVALTDKSGRFTFQLPRGIYRTLISKDALVSEESKQLSFEEIKLFQNQKNIVTIMSPIEKLSWEQLFSKLPKS